MSRRYSSLSCGCSVSCDNGGGLLGRCSSNNCQFNIWLTIHQLCDECNECLNCSNHEGHTKLDGLEYLKSILGI